MNYMIIKNQQISRSSPEQSGEVEDVLKDDSQTSKGNFPIKTSNILLQNYPEYKWKFI